MTLSRQVRKPHDAGDIIGQGEDFLFAPNILGPSLGQSLRKTRSRDASRIYHPPIAQDRQANPRFIALRTPIACLALLMS